MSMPLPSTTINDMTTSEHPSLMGLPTELLVKIILDLDWRSVLRLQLVGSEFNEIVKNHVAVQYRIELGISGMVNGPPTPAGPYNLDERLQRLRLYQSRWKHLDVSRMQTVRKVTGIWELASGILAQGVSTNVNEHLGRPAVRKLFFTKLPSSSRVDSKIREWSHEGYEFTIRDFTMDPVQDLLVLLRETSGDEKNVAEVHLRSLKTNEKHPNAKLGMLVHGLHGGTRGRSHSLQICQDRLAILHEARAGHWPEKLVVYNWKRGTLLFEISFCGIMSFAFLSPRHLLFAVQPFNVMPACHGDHQPRFLICDIDYTAALSPVGRPESYAAICEFHLPELKQYADVVDILIRADPAAEPYGSGSDPSDAVIPAPAFSTAPQNRLFTITLQVEAVVEDMGDHRPSEHVTLGLFVPLSTFLPFMSSENTEPEIIPANSDDEYLYFGDFHARPQRRIAVNWQDWMQHGARALLVPGAETIWVCNVFGSRCVYALEPRDVVVPLAPRHVAVLDFNVDALRRDWAQLSSRPSTATSTSSSANSHADDDEQEDKHESMEIDRGTPESDAASSSSSSSSSPGTLVEDHLDPSTLEAGQCGIFEEDVTTHLPYRRTVLREKMRFHGVMLTEDNVIFVNQRAPREYEVLTF